ncbi:MAG: PD-(D/E)XK nuclease family protein, partial [Acidobacteriaceae bacterium]|nr:PD-(D/E)XK nuclease family protein [Acidobacteriaceae bacterium]
VRDLIERTWLALGGPSILREPNQREDADTYLNALEKFDQGGTIRDFSLLHQRLDLLYAKPRIGGNCVQVMTIFQAKGLEFDSVIVPKLGLTTRPSERELLAWTEQVEENGATSLVVAAQPRKSEESQEYDQIFEEIKNKERQELKRIFYVACTRARNELFLLGSSKTKKQGSECSKAKEGTFLHLLWERVASDFEVVRRSRMAVVATQPPAEPPRTILRRLPARWAAPQLEYSVDWQPQLQRATASARTVTYEWVSSAGRHVGTVVHELLKRIATEGVAAWTPERVAAAQPLIESELLRLGVPPSENAEASSRVRRALARTLQSVKGRWVLSAHAEARSEWPVAGRIEDKLVAGTIDRVFRDEHGYFWIVDFKTSEHEGAGLETFLNEEQRRYRTQLENYGILMSRIARGPIWFGLYFPLLDGWREWQFAEQAALAFQLH